MKKTKLSTIESKQKEICVVFGSEASSDKENSEEEDDGDESYDDDEEPYYDSDEDKEKLFNTKDELSEAQLKNFKLCSVIGKGSFGKILLAKDKHGQLHIIKRIRKDVLENSKMMDKIHFEMKIMSKVKSPFLMQLNHFFESDLRYYLFMDFMAGKDLYTQLNRLPEGFKLSQIKFIAAQIVIGLDKLHSSGYVHKDIKTENVMIEHSGYVQIGDFGLACEYGDSTNSFKSGSPLYMSPEVFDDNEFATTYQVDWWALGIILYELHYKKSPFFSERISMIHDRGEALEELGKLTTNTDLEFPPDIEQGRESEYKKFKSLIKKLLVKDPEKRLGYSEDG